MGTRLSSENTVKTVLIDAYTIEPLAVGVHRFTSRYAQHFNSAHKKRGYVFQGRFRSIIVQDGAYMRRLVRYIHLNPVEAKLVTQPQDYQWSSYNGYIESAEYTWLHKDRVLSHFGTTRSEAMAEMAIHIKSKVDVSVDAEEIRRSFGKGIFGNQEFMEIYAPTKDIDPEVEDNKDASSTIDLLVNVVCEKFGITINELCSSEKRRHLVRARALLSRAAQMKRGLELRMVCDVLEKHHGTVSRLATNARNDQELESLAISLIDISE